MIEKIILVTLIFLIAVLALLVIGGIILLRKTEIKGRDGSDYRLTCLRLALLCDENVKLSYDSIDSKEYVFAIVPRNKYKTVINSLNKKMNEQGFNLEICLVKRSIKTIKLRIKPVNSDDF